MKLERKTSGQVSALPVMDKDGREHLVVILKYTFVVDANGKVDVDDAGPSAYMADLYNGEDPVKSSVRKPSDLFEHKPGTDVILIGHAHPPQGRGVSHVDVSLRAGTLAKTVRAFGLRVWQPSGIRGIAPGAALPMREPVPLLYELAWGGMDITDPQKPVGEPRNYVGRGVARDPRSLVDQVAAQLEDPAHPIGGGKNVPACFGALHRHWMPRASFAGTYDMAWTQTKMPLLPNDFDPRFHVTVPHDQWSETPLRGDEPIEVLGATPEGAWRFCLPRIHPGFSSFVDWQAHRAPNAPRHDPHRRRHALRRAHVARSRAVPAKAPDAPARDGLREDGPLMLTPLPRGEAVVVGVGARAHTGMTALQVAMAARAGKLMPRESHLVDRVGEPISTCRLASIPDNVMGVERFARLAAPPLVQAVYPWAALHRARGHEPPPVPLVLALPPEDWPGFDARIARELLDRIEALSQVAIDRKKSWLLHRCRAGGVAALCEGIERLSGRPDDLVVVGGVDSYFNPDVLEHLDAELRLHSLATENGFIPGEGAAFLALAPRSRATGMYRFAQVLGAAVEREPRPYGHDEPCQGLGMTLAMRKAAATVGPTARRVPWALTDVANERHRVDEWQLAFSRMFAIFSAPVVHQQPLLEMGDVGAASAPMLAAIACVGWQTGAHKGDCVMIAAHSDANERGALLLAREGEAQ